MQKLLELQRDLGERFNEFLIELIFSLMQDTSNNLNNDQDYIIARESLGTEWLLRQEIKWFYRLRDKIEHKMGFSYAKAYVDSIVNKIINKWA